MKIHIIGCSGSGKTYLAERLSRKFGIPHFDLDDMQWDNTSDAYGVKRPAQARAQMLQAVLENDDWIVEGVYYAWVEQSFEKADVIYVLDMPKALYVTRILRRFVRRKLGIERGKKETLRSVAALLKWTDTFQKKNMKQIRAMMERYADKTVWLSSRREVAEIIRKN